MYDKIHYNIKNKKLKKEKKRKGPSPFFRILFTDSSATVVATFVGLRLNWARFAVAKGCLQVLLLEIWTWYWGFVGGCPHTPNYRQLCRRLLTLYFIQSFYAIIHSLWVFLLHLGALSPYIKVLIRVFVNLYFIICFSGLLEEQVKGMVLNCHLNWKSYWFCVQPFQICSFLCSNINFNSVF